MKQDAPGATERAEALALFDKAELDLEMPNMAMYEIPYEDSYKIRTVLAANPADAPKSETPPQSDIAAGGISESALFPDEVTVYYPPGSTSSMEVCTELYTKEIPHAAYVRKDALPDGVKVQDLVRAVIRLADAGPIYDIGDNTEHIIEACRRAVEGE